MLRAAFLICLSVLSSFPADAANWKTNNHKDPMTGLNRVQKTIEAREGGVTLVAQISGYGESDNLVGGRSTQMLDLDIQNHLLRAKINGTLYWALVERAGKEFRDFIFIYACEAKPGPDFGCAKEDTPPFDPQIRGESLLNLLLNAKEIKLELPLYRKGDIIRTFR